MIFPEKFLEKLLEGIPDKFLEEFFENWGILENTNLEEILKKVLNVFLQEISSCCL